MLLRHKREVSVCLDDETPIDERNFNIQDENRRLTTYDRQALKLAYQECFGKPHFSAVIARRDRVIAKVFGSLAEAALYRELEDQWKTEYDGRRKPNNSLVISTSFVPNWLLCINIAKLGVGVWCPQMDFTYGKDTAWNDFLIGWLGMRRNKKHAVVTRRTDPLKKHGSL